MGSLVLYMKYETAKAMYGLEEFHPFIDTEKEYISRSCEESGHFFFIPFHNSNVSLSERIFLPGKPTNV